jgi:hypothetical protein
VCEKNEDGKYPSCLEAKYGGPGCEDIKLCESCERDLPFTVGSGGV